MRIPPSSPRYSAPGLALLEIAVALSMLALLAVVSYPRIDRRAEDRLLRMDLDTALRAMQWARRAALGSGASVQLCLPTEAGDCAGPADRLELRPAAAGEPAQVFQLRGGTVLWRGLRKGTSAGFDARGRPLGVTGSLYLCRSEGDELVGRIPVNRTGRIRLERGKKGKCPL